MLDKPLHRRRILFVDDDQAFLQTIERLMRLWSKESWEIVTAPSASAALTVLQEDPVNLVVIDVCMPVVDGLQFLSVVHRRYPDLQKLMLTGFATEAYRSACLSNGAELFVEKPKSSEGLESLFATIEELTRCKPEPGFRGMVRRVPLMDVIQMECLGRNSSVLAVTTPRHSGNIFIKEGTIVHAEVGDLMGEEAFYKLFALPSGDFKLNPFAEPSETSITSSWESLLMQAAHVRDENSERNSERTETDAEEIASGSMGRRTLFPNISATDDSARVEELLICSAGGDVLHAWQCPNSEFRINFLQFVGEKARLLENALQLGEFDRVEFQGKNERFVVQILSDRRVLVRTSLGAIEERADKQRTLLPGGPPSPSRRKLAQEWFEKRLRSPGLLAAGLQFSDRSGVNNSIAPNFGTSALETVSRCATETFQVLNLQRFKAFRARWVYGQIIIECAQWNDATSLVLLLARQTLEIEADRIHSCIGDFLNEGGISL